MLVHANVVRHFATEVSRYQARDWWSDCCWVGGRAAHRTHQLLCAIRGHDLMMHFEPHRLSLECTACGRQTPGWNLEEFDAPKSATARLVVIHQHHPPC